MEAGGGTKSKTVPGHVDHEYIGGHHGGGQHVRDRGVRKRVSAGHRERERDRIADHQTVARDVYHKDVRRNHAGGEHVRDRGVRLAGSASRQARRSNPEGGGTEDGDAVGLECGSGLA